MPLMDGNLKDLVKSNSVDTSELVQHLLWQMLSALQTTASLGLIHRDVKPANILFQKMLDQSYHFVLADFGLSHDEARARTKAGTEPFMAPEIKSQELKTKQTPKVDIWSLFATIIWVRDEESFRSGCTETENVHAWLVEIAKLPHLAHIKSMARIDPAKRPSAKALLKSLNDNAAAEAEPVIDENEDNEATIASGVEHMTLGEEEHEYGQAPGEGDETSGYTYDTGGTTITPGTFNTNLTAPSGTWESADWDTNEQNYYQAMGGTSQDPSFYEPYLPDHRVSGLIKPADGYPHADTSSTALSCR